MPGPLVVVWLVVLLGSAAWSCAKAKPAPAPTQRTAAEMSPIVAGEARNPFSAPSCPVKIAVTGDLPGVLPRHRDVDYWVSRLAEPDTPVLTSRSIAELNGRFERLEDLANTRAALFLPTPTEPALVKQLKALSDIRRASRSGAFVTLSGSPPDDSFFDYVQEAVESYQLSSRPRLVSELAPLRCQPTDHGLFELPVDAAFDQLLCSTLRPGEAVREISTHRGGWSLVRSSYAYGWVHTDALSAPIPEVDFAAYVRSSAFVVVTQDHVPIWKDPHGGPACVHVRRGLRLPLVDQDTCNGEPCYKTLAATRSGVVPGWIGAKHVHVGYLPFTQRQVLRQAFDMLDQPYGWGGLGGNRDCSQYLMDLFALFGVDLPRNSAGQSLAGSELVDVSTPSRTGTLDALERVLNASPPRIALLYLPGHIMLLLGKDDGDYWAIHQFSGYRVGCVPGHDTKMVVDRVAVTPLRLGEGSQRGSLRERLSRVIVFGQSSGEVSSR